MQNETYMEVRNPNTLSMNRLPVERVALGRPGDYKPCVARLPADELLLVAFRMGGDCPDPDRVREDILLFRSHDAARSWSEPVVLESLLGREPYLSVLRDGTVLMTVHLLSHEIRNTAGYTRAFVHRSEDGGRTWSTTIAEPERVPPENHQCCTSRNILELADGSLLLGVTGGGLGYDEIWRSYDAGRTWSEKYPASVPGIKDVYPYGVWGETHFWQARSGKIYAIIRIDPQYVAPIEGTSAPLVESNDQYDRMVLLSTTDEGRTWETVSDCGDYGEMYPSLLRLQDNRLLLTFTVREIKRPLGVRAVLGIEHEDGFELDFGRDRIMLDTKTALSRARSSSGGGFGPTIQLADGTLVTSHSWRDAEGALHLETARWRLPEP